MACHETKRLSHMRLYPNLQSVGEMAIIVGVRAGARMGYVIPGRDGNGGWRFEEILPPPPSPPPPSSVLQISTSVL